MLYVLKSLRYHNLEIYTDERLATRYPGQNVCVIFIGVVYVIGSESGTVVQCISLEARNMLWEFGQKFIKAEIIGKTLGCIRC